MSVSLNGIAARPSRVSILIEGDNREHGCP